MKTRILLCLCALAIVLTAALPRLGAQAPPENTPVRSASTLTPEQLLPLTCAQAWVVSDRNYAEMLGIVKTLAKISMANRDLTFPDTREAGIDAGRGIANDCKADPRALLFAIVDTHVRRVAGPEKN